MNAGPEVSIIMPVRNEAASLDATLASVCSQATDAPFEVIVVDDHSTDSTRRQDEKVGDHNAATGRPGMEERPLPHRAAAFVGVDGVAHAPVWTCAGM